MEQQSRSQRIASNVRAEVTRRNLTGQQVAVALGLTQPATSRRMRGHVEFSGSELARLAEFLEVPVSTLYGEVPA
jgi:transcriptional regulator with XRE-family HTH domain